MNNCTHTVVSCINPYELIRKYRCHSCCGIMMCACEEEFARRYLPHQLRRGVELTTQRRIPITLGFQKGICNKCRGIPEEAHPKASMHGRTSKVVRYYWREIHFETIRRFSKWAKSQSYANWTAARLKHRNIYNSIEKEVIKEIKKQHQQSPKYVYKEESQSTILKKNQVEVVKLEGIYVKKSGSNIAILDGDKPYSPEEFASRHFEQLGYEVLLTESIPFHALFGVFMWLVIQDSSDPKVRIVNFGDRVAFDKGIRDKQINTLLPEDFGTPGYAQRRAAAIEEHFALFPEKKNNELLRVFDYWVEPSADLRQYLWAYRCQDVDKARQIVSILPADTTRQILKYLTGNYWRRFCGWPDMIVYNQSEYFFAEVKSSKDKLSEDQKCWISGNYLELHLPFKLIKIHKLKTKRTSD